MRQLYEAGASVLVSAGGDIDANVSNIVKNLMLAQVAIRELGRILDLPQFMLEASDDVIFLHSSFRVSSTWLWSRFKAVDGILAFYEIFNERLAVVTREQAAKEESKDWRSKHPAGLSYFSEFIPLIREEGGVESYDFRMGMASFVPVGGLTGRLADSEKRYVSSLIAHAHRLGKRPLLSDTRTLGRIRALKHCFGGIHILVYRNLFHQWCSYSEQMAYDNPTFFNSIQTIIKHSQHDPYFAILARRFDIETLSIDNSDLFYAFVFMHLYIYSQMLDVSDISLDVTRVAKSPDLRRSMERVIFDSTRIALDLSDARLSLGLSLVDLGPPDELARTLHAGINEMFGLAPYKTDRGFIEQAIDDICEEYGRYRFYAGTASELITTRGIAGVSQRGASRVKAETLKNLSFRQMLGRAIKLIGIG
ncbi:MAG: hypothetical protein AB7U61_09615 [Methylocystis sp.]